MQADRPDTKRARGDNGVGLVEHHEISSDEPVRLRRLSVVFSSVSDSGSLDYIVTEQGVSAFLDA